MLYCQKVSSLNLFLWKNTVIYKCKLYTVLTRPRVKVVVHYFATGFSDMSMLSINLNLLFKKIYFGGKSVFFPPSTRLSLASKLSASKEEHVPKTGTVSFVLWN